MDELTDAQDDLELLNQDQIKQLVAESTDPQDLASNLMQLIPMASKAQFKANLDQALYAGDVLGYPPWTLFLRLKGIVQHSPM